MKIVVIGGSGLIGSKMVAGLTRLGHEAIAASPRSGVNAVTGEGLATVFNGADVVVDVSNSPSFEDQAVMAFFEGTGPNIAKAARAAGIGHYVALSVVGTDRLPDSGYFRAKLAQETLIKASGIPYSIVRATQFLEFLGAIAASSVVGDRIRVSNAAFQPIAADDVASAMVNAVLAGPSDSIAEIAGPERRPLNAVIENYLRAVGDNRPVIADADAGYFGARITDGSLVPGDDAQLYPTSLEEWLLKTTAGRA
jgi:uncharacterized protein YbjT (DUF2867 family)